MAMLPLKSSRKEQHTVIAFCAQKE